MRNCVELLDKGGFGSENQKKSRLLRSFYDASHSY